MPYIEVLPNETLPELVDRAAPQFSVQAIKEHEKNSHLFNTRTAYLLKTGDVIWIPDEAPERQWFSVSRGQTARFVASRNTRPFRLLLRYPEGTPVKGKEFILSVGEVSVGGKTDAEGMLDVRVPISATQALVVVDGYRKKIQIGALEPAHTAKGYQGRLRNLGYAVGPVDGIVGPKTRGAIRAFQRDRELELSARMDDETLSALTGAYGC